jgi:hypothetical protein
MRQVVSTPILVCALSCRFIGDGVVFVLWSCRRVCVQAEEVVDMTGAVPGASTTTRSRREEATGVVAADTGAPWGSTEGRQACPERSVFMTLVFWGNGVTRGHFHP